MKDLGDKCLNCEHFCSYHNGDDSITDECTNPFECEKEVSQHD